ncbi:protein F43G9.7, partial [Aphelenchoides avenae]
MMQKKVLLSSLARGKKISYSALKTEARATDWNTHGRINEQYEQVTEKLKRCMKAATDKEEDQFRSRLSEDTRRKLAVLKSLKATPANAERYRALATELRQQVANDHKVYREDNNGSRKTNRREIEDICRNFYTQLFDSKVNVERNRPETDDEAEPLPPVTWEEVKKAIRSMKLGKAPGPDGITTEHLRAGGQPLWNAPAKLFNTCPRTGRTPEGWKESKTVLLYKKGDPENIANYRPICLLSVVYKVFTKLILTRLTETLDAAQPPEQAGFRSGYCTMDHLQTINQLQGKAPEFGQRLFIVFIDYEKAFDSIEMNAVWNALEEQGVDPRYVSLLEETNTGCTTDITLFRDPIRIPVRRGVRQGDTISPKLFTAALESIFRGMNWDGDKRAGVSIDGRRLNHLRFADDIALVGRSMADLDFDTQQGLKLGEETIVRTWKYIYLGQEVRWDHKLDGEITRRQKAAWNAYNNVKDALKNLTDAKLRANLFNTTVLPALLNGCETWAPTQNQERRIA